MKRILAAAVLTTCLTPIPAIAQGQPGQQPNAPARAENQVRPVAVSQIKGKDVYNLQGKELGEVERVILGQGDQVFAVIKFGEFLGLGGESRILPLSRMALREDRLVVPGMSEAEFKALPAWKNGLAGYRDADAALQVRVPVQLAANTAEGARIVVSQPAPTVLVDPADPRVVVRQNQPNVTVNQAQPEIIVRQPRPTVTVDIPQPEIIVRMPKPDVDVAMAPPQVQVNQAPPQVQVAQGQRPRVQVAPAEPQVLVQKLMDEPNVQVQAAAGEPRVRYERAEPRVVVNQAQGEPNVRIERVGRATPGENQRGAAETASVNPGARDAWSFGAFDRDRNRSWTREEFNPFVTRVYGAWDGNRNRRLERNEFYGGLHGLWDFDRDGRLTQAEYNRAWGLWGEGLDRIEFSQFDRNRDGWLDRDEYVAGWRDDGLFERWDADRQGWLAANEFGDGLFGLWDRQGVIAEADITPWLGYNWGIGPVAALDTNAIEPRRDPIDTGAIGRTRAWRIGDLQDREIYNLRGEKLGEVKRVVYNLATKQKYVVLEHGGFLGLGEKEVPLPANRVFVRGDRLVVRGMTEAEVNALPDWDMNNREYRAVAANETLEVGLI